MSGKFVKIEVTGVKLTVTADRTIRLTDAQAAIRKHLLDDEGEKIYRVVKPVEFKRGETIEVLDTEFTPSTRAVAVAVDPESKQVKEPKPAKPAKEPKPKDPNTADTAPGGLSVLG